MRARYGVLFVSLNSDFCSASAAAVLYIRSPYIGRCSNDTQLYIAGKSGGQQLIGFITDRSTWYCCILWQSFLYNRNTHMDKIGSIYWLSPAWLAWGFPAKSVQPQSAVQLSPVSEDGTCIEHNTHHCNKKKWLTWQFLMQSLHIFSNNSAHFKNLCKF